MWLPIIFNAILAIVFFFLGKKMGKINLAVELIEFLSDDVDENKAEHSVGVFNLHLRIASFLRKSI